MPDRASFHRDGMRVGGLVLDGVSFERRGRRVLDSVSFTLAPGRLLAVVGASGAGKSTLLSLIAGFEPLSAGAISCMGRVWDRVGRVGDRHDTGARAKVGDRHDTGAQAKVGDRHDTAHHGADRGIGMCFDDAALHEHLTVAENLDSAALARHEPPDRRTARVNSLAATLGLSTLLSRKPATLSAGERRRTAVGRAFIRSPDLVLLDEPFANLDRGNRFTVRQMVRELQRSTGAMAIMVTHDPTDALAIADDMLVLINGRARAHGPAVDIAARPIDIEVAQLVDDLGMHALELHGDAAPAGCSISSEFLANARTAANSAHLLLGLRPWQIRAGVPQKPAISVDARIIAHEPAGLFTDVIATRADGRALRARLPAREAQELPTTGVARFHIHEEDIHIFAAPWPGRRIR